MEYHVGSHPGGRSGRLFFVGRGEFCGAAEESQSEAQATAESLIGEDVQTLIDAIGEPESTAYQDSCAVADAQDGFWTYDGFTVVTLKTAEGETVQDIQ